jgi:hypothetical protein
VLITHEAEKQEWEISNQERTSGFDKIKEVGKDGNGRAAF